MTRLTLAGTTAIAALLAGNAALADITPEEVWQNWQDMASGYGQTMTATSTVRDGNTLIVSGMTVAQDQDELAVIVAIDEVRFADNGNGTVDITMSDSYDLAMTTPGADGETPTNVTMTIAQPGMVTTVSGTSAETAYAVEAPSITVSLAKIDGVDAAAVDATAQVVMTGVSGDYTVSGPTEAKVLDVAFGTQGAAFTVAFKDPETTSDVQMTGTVADLAVAYALDFAGMTLSGSNLAEALRAGTAMSAEFTHGAMDLTVDVTEADSQNRVVATANGGGLTFAMDESGLDYAVNGTGTRVTITSPDLPFPELNIAYGEIAFNIAMPLLASAEPTDFAFLTRIVDLVVSDEVWGMIDPQGSLPRDPATVVIDTKGRARLTADLVDEVAMARLGETPPGEIHALDVTEIGASIAGAALTGSGAFTFDNTDLVTFNGMPVPTGTLALNLLGGNGLLDKLVGLGLFSQDDANGARMMMSLFANTGPGADELNSTLEFKDKGFYANGQRLQ